MLSVATLMPNIRHDYPGDWQAERSQSRRVLELLPLDTAEVVSGDWRSLRSALVSWA